MFNAACGQSSRRTFRPAPAQTLFNKTRLSLAISALLAAPCAVLAAPVIGNGGVTSGVAAIVQQGNVTSINQSSHKATINWQSFSTAPRETVNFNQPNAASVTLNRVIGNEASVLQGALNANGQVFLLNSNGVLIGKTASINTAGFVASTLGLSDADFNSGHYRFESHGASQGTLINQGTIAVADGGYAALLGQSVTNQGVIVANKGTVSLNSGERITLNFNGDSLLNVSIDQGTLNALVDNQHAIQADGGQVILTARAADDVLGSQVNNSGIIQAQTLDDITGNITLYAHGGTAHINGTLDASAPQTGNGGFIETSGNTVNIADNAIITTQAQNGHTGTWLIDPTDFTVGAGGDISGAQLSNTLANNNVTIESIKGKREGKGNILIFEAVSWANNTLTLDAENDIHINNAMTISGENGQLVMNTHPDGDYHIRTKASYSGAVLDANGKPVAKQDTSGGIYGSITFTNESNKSGLTINNDTYTLIHNMDELANISGIRGHYALARSLEGGAHTKAVVDTLDGTLSGLGHVVDNLTINASSSNIGLIGRTNANTALRDIGVTNVDIAGGGNVGSLLGRNNAANVIISNAYSSGKIFSVSNSAGGLIGSFSAPFSSPGSIVLKNAFSTVDVTSTGSNTGGLVGYMLRAVITHAHASGNVTSSARHDTTIDKGGGLVGSAGNSSIGYAYATGDVTLDEKSNHVGGLVGNMSLIDGVEIGYMKNSYASGNTTGGEQVGGLIGYLAISSGAQESDFFVTNLHASGNVTALKSRRAGGLVGEARGLQKINALLMLHFNNVSASGNVTGQITGSGLGGLVGYMDRGTISGSHASGNVTAGGHTGGVGGLMGGAGDNTIISNSYATGTVYSGWVAGSLIGSSGSTVVINSYWKAQEGQDGIITARAIVSNSQGLNAKQLPDIQFYANGTIEAVLAARDEAAALQARMNVAGQQAAVLTQAPKNENASAESFALTGRIPPIDSQLAFSPRDFHADIDSVDSDGTRFNLTTDN